MAAVPALRPLQSHDSRSWKCQHSRCECSDEVQSVPAWAFAMHEPYPDVQMMSMEGDRE